MYEPYAEENSHKGPFDFDSDLVIIMVIILIQIVKFVLLCCMKNCVTWIISLIWIALEALIVDGLAIVTLRGEVIVCAPMLSLGLSLMCLVWPLLYAHWNFVAHHLTEKEFHARLEVMNEK